MAQRWYVVFALLLAGCNDPPCSDEGRGRATEAFGQCLAMEQSGDGGVGCGRRAYQTFCRKDR
jgi:hypothetical protein